MKDFGTCVCRFLQSGSPVKFIVKILFVLALWEHVEATPIVSTRQGLVRGYTTAFAHVYKGIPYAQPPVGDLRWQPPKPPSGWGSRVRNVTDSGPGCPQVLCDKTTPKIACPTNLSEDCLFLEVFTPLGAKNGSDLPVMIFIHGGNFFYMSGTSLLFDGEVMASRGNVIQVNINYRLGALGFLVTGRDDGAAQGNYGILDQRMAFVWVQDNIRGFGGDPSKVTLFGQSAGSQSILHHMMSSKSAPYFRATILESDPISLPYRNFDEALMLGGLLAENLGCQAADMKCLRSKPALDIAKAAYATRGIPSSFKLLELFEPYGPYVDGVEIKGQPYDVVREFGVTDPSKPFIIGSLTEETVLYIYSAFNSTIHTAEYLGVVAAFKPSHATRILMQYPPHVFANDQREVMVNMSTDYVFACPTRYLARSLVTQKGTSAWLYVWNHAMSFDGWGHVTFCKGRVCHGSELPYVFDTASKGNFTMTSDEKKLSYDVIDYWTSFAWTGDPNQKAKVTHDSKDRTREPMPWPKYTPSAKWPLLVFETPARKTIHGYKQGYCDFWDSIGYT